MEVYGLCWSKNPHGKASAGALTGGVISEGHSQLLCTSAQLDTGGGRGKKEKESYPCTTHCQIASQLQKDYLLLFVILCQVEGRG